MDILALMEKKHPQEEQVKHLQVLNGALINKTQTHEYHTLD